MQELVTVIVPVYNVEAYLRKCVESIICQTYDKLEIILVNDGSTDNSSKICDEYLQKDERIKVIHKKNGGQSSARNVAINVCKGSYIAFIDSDDWVESDYIEQFMKSISQDTIVCCGYNVVYKTKIVENTVEVYKEVKVDEFVDLMLTYELKKANNTNINPIGCYMWNKLWPRKCFETVRFPDCKYEDIYVFLELFSCVKKIVLIPESKYCYVQRGNSTVYSDYFLDSLNARLKQEKDVMLYFGKHVEKAMLITAYSCIGCLTSPSVKEFEYERYKKIVKKKINREIYKYPFIILKVVVFLYFTHMYLFLKNMRRRYC